MNFYNLAKNRFSVRSFLNQPIEQEKVNYILKAANLAPTAANRQPHRIIVITDKQKLTALKDCTVYTFNAPLNFLICYDNTKSWVRPCDNENMGYVDASIVTTHMMLAIADVGLGSTWVGHFDIEKIKKLFNLPQNIIPIALLPTGYSSADAKPSIKHEDRLPINEFVYYDEIK